ncbi:hypothetical protein F5Y15DRAFT_61296 [Xylariaceae sp. FL0016]|nr:hypothetical protein F5Y15DRAFT_61296 [Xylariaceae sp. FL0016]
MQALFSRAAQAQSSCRCRMCLHTAHTIARRSTTATTKRKVSAADVFTAFYTTILGTAAALDARKKDLRRRELDKRLDKARAAVSSLAVQESPDTPYPEAAPVAYQEHEIYTQSQGSSPNTYQKRETEVIPNVSEDGKSRDNTSALLRGLRSLHPASYRAPTCSSKLQDQQEWIDIENGILLEEQSLSSRLREPTSLKKINRTTVAVTDLVDKLLDQNSLHIHQKCLDDSGIGAPTEVQHPVMAEIESIRGDIRYPSYNYPSEDPDGATGVRCLLRQAIQTAFNTAQNSQEMVGRICYNLLMSSMPPSIHTYHAMVSGFHRVGRPDLAQIVVDSYIQKSSWPATQQTMVCLLNHFRATNNIEGFRDINRRMRGVKDTGLNYAIFPKKSSHDEEWLDWATKNCASRKSAFVQRAYRGPEVFNSLIKGWLHFGQLGAASMAYIASLRSGITVPSETLRDLLESCVMAVDHAAARVLVMGISKNLKTFMLTMERMLHHGSMQALDAAVAGLFDVLHVCWLPVLNLCGSISDTHRQVSRNIANVIATIQSQRKAALGVNLNTRPYSHSMTSFTRLAMVLAVETRCRHLETKTEAISTLVKACILKLETGIDIDPLGVFACNKATIEKSMSETQKRLSEAARTSLEHIRFRPGQMKLAQVKRDLSRKLPDQVLAKRLKSSGDNRNIHVESWISLFAPGALKAPPVEVDGHDRRVQQLELDLLDAEECMKAFLFARVSHTTQKMLRRQYTNWYTMPLAKLVQYHLIERKSLAEDIGHTPETVEGDLSIAAERPSDDPPPVILPKMVFPTSDVAVASTWVSPQDKGLRDESEAVAMYFSPRTSLTLCDAHEIPVRHAALG